MQLRLKYYRDQREQTTVWTFVPLRNKRQAPQYLRDDRTSSEGEPLRRPYAKQRVKLITFGAGLLRLGTDGDEKFEIFQDSHSIEFNEAGAGEKAKWVEYAPDLESQAELALLDDLDDLVSCEIRFIEKKPRYYNDW